MTRNLCVAAALVAMGTVVWGTSAGAQDTLNAEVIRNALKTSPVEEDEYISFLVTLVEQNRLKRTVVESSFEWARHKPHRPFLYFKRAAIEQADRSGVKLPSQTPSQSAEIEGRVVQRAPLLDIPLPYVEVRIIGTDIRTRTNPLGYFTLSNVPWGTHAVEAVVGSAPLLRTVSTRVYLPYLPNDSRTVILEFPLSVP